jgi:hypothetical protein
MGKTSLTRVIKLPKPSPGKGRSLYASLMARRTTREISSKKLAPQILSDLLWSACGINRKKGPFGVPGITAASASNSQEIEIYVILEEGAYLYVPEKNILTPAASGDLRVMGIGKGQGGAGAKAPVRLVYVVDIDKFSRAGFQEPGLKDPETQKAYYFIDAGIIAGNVYLFAASRGLAVWFHNCDKPGLTAGLKLREDQRVLFGQTVGYPEKR